MQTTLIILKPDTVQRGLIGRVLTRFEEKGLRLVAAKMMLVPRDLAHTHYAEHDGKPFYPGLIEFITSSPVMVLAVRGVEAIAVCRALIGATNGRQASPGTVRGDFGMSGGYNLIHGSDSEASARRELDLWFSRDELLDYEPAREAWSYDRSDRNT